MQNIVIDSGPLIALFDKSDSYHQQAVRCIETVSSQSVALHTNLAVITEVVYMLDFSVQAQDDFLYWVARACEVDGNTLIDFPRIRQIIQKYNDLPADFADASLVALCERLQTQLVLSLDSDFTVYRNAAKQEFTNVFFA